MLSLLLVLAFLAFAILLVLLLLLAAFGRLPLPPFAWRILFRTTTNVECYLASVTARTSGKRQHGTR